jgi:hypothetical protein
MIMRMKSILAPPNPNMGKWASGFYPDDTPVAELQDNNGRRIQIHINTDGAMDITLTKDKRCLGVSGIAFRDVFNMVAKFFEETAKNPEDLAAVKKFLAEKEELT